MKCPSCKTKMRNFGSLLELGSEYWCENKECLFYHIRRYLTKEDVKCVDNKQEKKE